MVKKQFINRINDVMMTVEMIKRTNHSAENK